MNSIEAAYRLLGLRSLSFLAVYYALAGAMCCHLLVSGHSRLKVNQGCEQLKLWIQAG